MQRPRTLTAAFVRTINRPGRYGDGRGGHGLSLLVKATANGRWSKTWAQRLRIGGRGVSLGLGSYPAVSLALARERALANRQAVEEGRDPRRRHAVTFGDAMEAMIDLHRPNWKPTSNTEQQWRSLLANHIGATIGATPVADVSAADVVAVLDRVWDRPELARRTARRISTTMKWAMGRGLRDSDPTAAAVAAMPKHRHRPNHHRALHHSDLPEALNKIQASQAATVTKLALELMVLTATRPGEVRHAFRHSLFELAAAGAPRLFRRPQLGDLALLAFAQRLGLATAQFLAARSPNRDHQEPLAQDKGHDQRPNIQGQQPPAVPPASTLAGGQQRFGVDGMEQCPGDGRHDDGDHPLR